MPSELSNYAEYLKQTARVNPKALPYYPRWVAQFMASAAGRSSKRLEALEAFAIRFEGYREREAGLGSLAASFIR